jgi:hypothetical protein
VIVRKSDRGQPPGVIQGVVRRVSARVRVAGCGAVGVEGPAFRGGIGIGGARFLIARRVRVGYGVRVAVRGGGEQSLLSGRIITVRESVPVRFRRDKRAAVVIECLRIRVTIGICNAGGKPVWIIHSRGRSGGSGDAGGTAPGVQSPGRGVRELVRRGEPVPQAIEGGADLVRVGIDDERAVAV